MLFKKSPANRLQLTDTIASFCAQAVERGLTEVQIIDTLEIVLQGKGTANRGGLTDVLATKLIKHLYPRGAHLRDEILIGIMGNLGNHRPCSFAVQAQLLRWSIMVFGLIVDLSRIQQLYGVLFHYLGYETLRPHVCHLLFLLTRREHVKPFRIQRLMSMQRSLGAEPCILGLLRVYKDYYPNIVVTDIPNTKATLFRYPDGNWLRRLIAVRQGAEATNATDSLGLAIRATRGGEVALNSGTKRRKLETASIPAIKTLQSDERSVTIEEIADLNELAGRIDRLQLPSQLASLLDHRYLQHIVVSHPSATTIARIGNWLAACLMDEVSWNDHNVNSKARIDDLLEKVTRFTWLTKELIPVIEVFIADYLQTWNGLDHAEGLLELISYIRPMAWEELYPGFVKPLYLLFTTASSTWKAALIQCYRSLIRHWALRGATATRQHGNTFEPANEDIDLALVIQELIVHVDFLACCSLKVHCDNIRIEHATLSFFETCARLSSQYDISCIVIPSAPVIFRFCFTPSSMPLSRISGIVSWYKEEFEEFERSYDQEDDHDGLLGVNRRQYITYFNSHVMDMCNCIWRNRSLNRTDENANGCQLNEQVISKIRSACEENRTAMSHIFSLTHSSATAYMISRYNKRVIRADTKDDMSKMVKRIVVEAQRTLRPITSGAIKEFLERFGEDFSSKAASDVLMAYKVGLLEHLKDHYSMYGLYEFLYTCMRTLIERRRSSMGTGL